MIKKYKSILTLGIVTLLSLSNNKEVKAFTQTDLNTKNKVELSSSLWNELDTREYVLSPGYKYHIYFRGEYGGSGGYSDDQSPEYTSPNWSMNATTIEVPFIPVNISASRGTRGGNGGNSSYGYENNGGTGGAGGINKAVPGGITIRSGSGGRGTASTYWGYGGGGGGGGGGASTLVIESNNNKSFIYTKGVRGYDGAKSRGRDSGGSGGSPYAPENNTYLGHSISLTSHSETYVYPGELKIIKEKLETSGGGGGDLSQIIPLITAAQSTANTAHSTATAAQTLAQSALNTANTKWTYNENTIKGVVVNNATKLANARNIALSGDATGSVNFDGSSNVSIPVTLSPNTKKSLITIPEIVVVSGKPFEISFTGGDVAPGSYSGVTVTKSGDKTTLKGTLTSSVTIQSNNTTVYIKVVPAPNTNKSDINFN